MTTRFALVLLLASCRSAAWKPAIWNEGPSGLKGREVAFPFPDGTNGTELVLAMMAVAKEQEATSISNLEIQVGTCKREIATRPRVVAAVPLPATERIVFRARETAFTCRKLVKQILVPPEGGIGGKKKLSDAQMETTDDCSHTPVERVVMRYRYEIEHGFITPDWSHIEQWTGAPLAFGAPVCGHSDKNEIRAVFHVGGPRPPALPAARPSDRAAEIISLAKRADETGDAKEATDLAARALSKLDADMRIDAPLADAIAAAHFFSVESDIEKFLQHELPTEIDDRWATRLGAEIDRIARSYERIGEHVRVPQAARWLREGGLRIARLHRHVAKLLDAAGQFPAADKERAKALVYER